MGRTKRALFFLGLLSILALQITYLCYRKTVTVSLPIGEWRSASSLSCENCTDRLGCYAAKEEPEFCGRCLPCLRERPDGAVPSEVERNIVFALKASSESRAKLLVLIASIHKHYKDVQILLYEEGNRKKDQHSIELLRNVKVRRFADAFGNMNVSLMNRTPFYIYDAIANHRSVIWLSEDLEWKRSDVFESLGAVKSSFTVFGGEPLEESDQSGVKLGFAPFFPGYSLGEERNFPAMMVRRVALPMLKWMMSCFASDPCGRCESREGKPIDCFPYLLKRLSPDFSVRRVPLPASLDRQRWAPPSCDFFCLLKFFALVVFVIIFICLVVFFATEKLIPKKTS